MIQIITLRIRGIRRYHFPWAGAGAAVGAAGVEVGAATGMGETDGMVMLDGMAAADGMVGGTTENPITPHCGRMLGPEMVFLGAG